jgi:uncharacterized protein YodC (DUF2158 family)
MVMISGEGGMSACKWFNGAMCTDELVCRRGSVPARLWSAARVGTDRAGTI